MTPPEPRGRTGTGSPKTPTPSKPLGISMGCPAGIGPEIIVKFFAGHPEWLGRHRAVVLGDLNILNRAAGVVGAKIHMRPWSPDAPGRDEKALFVEPVTALEPANVPFGDVTAVTGKASYDYVIRGIELCVDGQTAGLVTAPISKFGLKLAGISYPGHTEILADHTRTSRYGMMLAGGSLRVVLVTIHCPLKEVASRLNREKILDTVRLTDQALRGDFGLEAPKIAVAGLNPHAGESGMFGDEEERLITPAVEAAQDEGILAQGPFPPDTVFYHASQGRFDAVVCMYHDQGLIPLKLLHFHDGVNVTLGLPIIRTSVDHGTAYDIAGRGIADPSSLGAALAVAETMARHRGNP